MVKSQSVVTHHNAGRIPALFTLFRVVEDPRIRRKRVHSLDKILLIALFAIAGGIASWRQIEEFGRLHADWFARYVDTSAGIPSHDTFRRVFGLLLPEVTQKMLQEWFETRGVRFSKNRQICIDGKTVRGASNWDDEEGTTNIISAYCPKAGVTLAQVLVPDKANEISTAPTLLGMLDLRGATITGDAAYTQKSITKAIVKAGGSYCLALKNNHRILRESVEALFARRQPSIEYHETVEKNRGRIETRRLSVSRNVDDLPHASDWADLACVVRLDSYRQRLDCEKEVVPETRFYISNLSLSPADLLDHIRSHWRIENNLHRTLDVQFREDSWVMRRKTAAANLSVLRKVAGTMLSQIDGKKALTHKQMWVHGSEEFRDRLIHMQF